VPAAQLLVVTVKIWQNEAKIINIFKAHAGQLGALTAAQRRRPLRTVLLVTAVTAAMFLDPAVILRRASGAVTEIGGGVMQTDCSMRSPDTGRQAERRQPRLRASEPLGENGPCVKRHVAHASDCLPRTRSHAIPRP
jgi:hypothetical protein